jgi:ABC-type glycerol-3-phosphate transport system substrate-binding protein
MIVIREKTMTRIILVVLFLAGFFTAYLVRRSQVRIGEHYLWLNPFAQINPKKQYTLRVWDYDLPIGTGDQSYNQYFKKMLADFEKEYPNIRVELTLIDLIDGEKKLQQALSRNKAPDVYCSFSSVPQFYHQRQIPVGPFLNRKTRMMYLRPVSDLYGTGKGLCSFPRWISTDIWVGNRRLLRNTGLDIPKIQNEGWGRNKALLSLCRQVQN